MISGPQFQRKKPQNTSFKLPAAASCRVLLQTDRQHPHWKLANRLLLPASFPTSPTVHVWSLNPTHPQNLSCKSLKPLSSQAGKQIQPIFFHKFVEETHNSISSKTQIPQISSSLSGSPTPARAPLVANQQLHQRSVFLPSWTGFSSFLQTTTSQLYSTPLFFDFHRLLQRCTRRAAEENNRIRGFSKTKSALSLYLCFLLYRYLLNDPHVAKPQCHDPPCGETIMSGPPMRRNQPSMTPQAGKKAEQNPPIIHDDHKRRNHYVMIRRAAKPQLSSLPMWRKPSFHDLRMRRNHQSMTRPSSMITP